jgi:hypothetical protein
VRDDGSGILRERVLISKAFTGSMRAMTEKLAQLGGTAPGEEFDVVDEKELREKAAQMGKGVYLISIQRLDTKSAEGYRATYGFRDINQLRINQNPSAKAPSGAGGAGMAMGGGGKAEYITFALRRGEPTELIVRTPGAAARGKSESEPSPPVESAGAEVDTEMVLAQMTQFFQGFRIAMRVEVIGDIVETNATHHTKSQVTLMELDFGKLLETPAKLREFASRKPGGIEDAKALMESIEGIKVELKPELKVKFNGLKLRAA